MEVKRATRRRRRAGTINRMGSMKLDIFAPDQLDLKNYVYRWVCDEGSRMREATRMDDYDYVGASEIHGYDADESDSESGERVRMYTGQDKAGKPIYSYLLKKPREFFEDDMDEAVSMREAMMDGVVYRAEGADEDLLPEITDEAADERGNFYVPKGVELGSAAARRRGPVKAGTKFTGRGK